MRERAKICCDFVIVYRLASADGKLKNLSEMLLFYLSALLIGGGWRAIRIMWVEAWFFLVARLDSRLEMKGGENESWHHKITFLRQQKRLKIVSCLQECEVSPINHGGSLNRNFVALGTL